MQFINRHLGVVGAEAQEDMLRVIGFNSMDEFINATVPQSIIARGKLKLPEAATESQALQELKEIAGKNEVSGMDMSAPSVTTFPSSLLSID